MKIFDMSTILWETDSIVIDDENLEKFDKMLNFNGVDHCFALPLDGDNKKEKMIDGEEAVPSIRVLYEEENMVMFELTFLLFYKSLGVSDERIKQAAARI